MLSALQLCHFVACVPPLHFDASLYWNQMCNILRHEFLLLLSYAVHGSPIQNGCNYEQDGLCECNCHCSDGTDGDCKIQSDNSQHHHGADVLKHQLPVRIVMDKRFALLCGVATRTLVWTGYGSSSTDNWLPCCHNAVLRMLWKGGCIKHRLL